jgi:hypothetical protein
MNSRLKFSAHAQERRFERKITRDDVRHVLQTGEVINEYPSDNPLPSYLMLGWTEEEDGRRPIHVVAADDDERNITYVITVYEPNPDLWTDDFRRKINHGTN